MNSSRPVHNSGAIRRGVAALIALTTVACVRCAPAAEPGEVQSSEVARPSGLMCELLLSSGNAAIADPQPEFGWRCGTGESAYRQSAYQILVHRVGDSPATADPESATVAWDSGQTTSDQSLGVSYGGKPLQPRARFEWQVRTWDALGEPSDWSARQSFRMASELSAQRTTTRNLAITPQPAKAAVKSPDGVWRADFGRAAFGYLTLNLLAAETPRTLEVRFGERLRDGAIDRAPGGTIRYYAVAVAVPAGAATVTVRPPRDRRNTTGDAIRLPQSIGVIAPFRYAEVELIDGAVELKLAATDIVRHTVQYPFDDDASRFECSDKTLNSIWELCKYSIRATTFCGLYVDGDRERIPYEADAYINQLAHYGVDQEYALARATHDYLMVRPTWPTEWKQHSVLMAWADYLYTADGESLATHYESLQRDKMLTAVETASGLVDTSLGDYRNIVDWPENERDGYEMRPVNTVVNAFHYATLDRMARIAAALGKGDEAAAFRQRAVRMQRKFNRALWSDKNNAYVDGLGSTHSSIHANLFPLAFGMVPPDRVDAVCEFVESRRMACSVYAAQYLLEGLYQHDRQHYAQQLLSSKSRRSWFNMLRSGSTITLEAWDERYKPNLDWNHAWGAAPAGIIPMYLVGVRPAEPGFKSIAIQPRPGDLAWFSARVPSPRGPIDVRYKRDSDSIRLDVTVPGNATAAVAVPLIGGEAPVSVTLDGEIVSPQFSGNFAWFENLPPGPHQILATLGPAAANTSQSNAAAN